jgi:hypothetical protein
MVWHIGFSHLRRGAARTQITDLLFDPDDVRRNVVD